MKLPHGNNQALVGLQSGSLILIDGESKRGAPDSYRSHTWGKAVSGGELAEMKRCLIIIFLLLVASPAFGAPMVENGRKLLSHYGWVCGTDTVQMAFPVPESLVDGPQAAYQRASQAIGYDLSPAKGKEVTLIRYTLTRRSEVTKSLLFAHVAFFKNQVIGAWLTTNGPIAPGIVPLSEDSFGKDF